MAMKNFCVGLLAALMLYTEAAAVSCPDPDPMDFATITGDGRLTGDTVQYECNYGYFFPDSLTTKIITCDINGAWTINTEFCSVSCPDPDPMDFANITGDGRLTGDTVQYECLDGYFFPNSLNTRNITCDINGAWTINTEFCSDICFDNLCDHSGVCIIQGNGLISCECTEGFSGERCSVVMRELGCWASPDKLLIKNIDLYNGSLGDDWFKRCVDYCFEKGHEYVEVRDGVKCGCGHMRDSAKYKMHGESTKCSTLCPGNITETCGGNVSSQIYTIETCGDLRSTCAERGSRGECYHPETIVWMNAYCKRTCRTCDNVALRLETKQHSTDQDGNSSRAVDGNRISHFSSNSCTKTTSTDKPWWAVDLQWRRRVQLIRITSGAETDLGNLNIGSTDTDPDIEAPTVDNIWLCAFTDSLKAGVLTSFQCLLPGSVGRWLVIFLDGSDLSLTLCEVELYMKEGLSGVLRFVPYNCGGNYRTNGYYANEEKDGSLRVWAEGALNTPCITLAEAGAGGSRLMDDSYRLVVWLRTNNMIMEEMPGVIYNYQDYSNFDIIYLALDVNGHPCYQAMSIVAGLEDRMDMLEEICIDRTNVATWRHVEIVVTPENDNATIVLDGSLTIHAVMKHPKTARGGVTITNMNDKRNLSFRGLSLT